jgi:hypothetical protein
MKPSRLGTAVCASVLAATLVACTGGSDKVDPKDYATGVCSSMSSWLHAVQARVSKVGAAVSPATSPSEGRDIFAGYLDGVLDDTQRMIDRIQAIGVPDVDGGEQMSKRLLTTLEGTKATFEIARKQVDSLPTNNRDAFRHAVEALSTAISSHVSDVAKALADVSSSELDQAFQGSQACRALGAGT